MRNIRPFFSHALGGLSVGYPLAAFRAVFGIVGLRRKGRAALGTLPHILCFEKLCLQFFIKRKYGNPKPLEEQRIGNELRAYASVPVIQ